MPRIVIGIPVKQEIKNEEELIIVDELENEITEETKNPKFVPPISVEAFAKKSLVEIMGNHWLDVEYLSTTYLSTRPSQSRFKNC